MPRGLVLLCACAALTVATVVPHSVRAQGKCSNLLGKQITLRGDVTYVERLQIGNTRFDVIIARTTDPSCGTIQTTGKARSCQVGMKFVGIGELRSGPASRSAGSKKASATDYGFEPISDETLCR